MYIARAIPSSVSMCDDRDRRLAHRFEPSGGTSMNRPARRRLRPDWGPAPS